MSSNTPQSAHQALLNLERSSAPSTELLDEAARILGVGFEQIREDLFAKPENELQRSTSSIPIAPKEEWTLRWLLKKTKPSTKDASESSEIKSPANDDHRKWLLFYYLVGRTPIKKLAKISRDQDAMQQIRDALYHQVVTQTKSGSLAATSIPKRNTSHESEDDDYETPQGRTKKRKRSPATKESSDGVSPTLQIVFSILKTLTFCLDNALAQKHGDAVAQQHLRIALSLPPEMVAAIIGHILQLMRLLGDSITPAATRNELLRLLQGSLHLWDLRHGPDLGHTVDESNDAFISCCLLTVLQLLKSMKDEGDEGQFKELKSRLDKMVAVHAVEPARQMFFKDLARTWKSDQDPLQQDHIKLVIDRLDSLMSRACVESSDSVAERARIWNLTAPLLLEIAIRSSPRSTVIRAQHEQPWLEALFVYLAHTVGCSLIDLGTVAMQVDEMVDETIAKQRSKASHFRRSSNPVSSLKRLLGVLLQRKVSVSLPILSSLVHHFGGLHEAQIMQWGLVYQIMQLDINVFLPNSGMSNSSSDFIQLIKHLDVEASFPPLTGDPVTNDQSLYLDVLTCLMEGFGFARDLGTFLNIWMDRLAAVEDSRIRKKSLDVQLPEVYSLWDDEDTLARFAEVAKKYALSTFLGSFMMRRNQALQDETYNGKHYALILVLDVFVTTHWDEMASVEQPLTLPVMLNEKMSGKAHGWVHRLSRHMFLVCVNEPRPSLSEDVYEGNQKAMIETAIHKAQSNPDYFRLMQAFQDVERIHTFITMAAVASYWEKSLVTREISALAKSLVELKHDDKFEELATAQVWDGRAINMHNSLAMITAFLGIFLQNPKVLSLDIEVTIELVKAMAPFLTDEGDYQSAVSSLMKAIILDEQLVSTPGFVKKSLKALGFMDRDEISNTNLKFIQSLPKEALSKSQRKQVAEWQRKRRMLSRPQVDGSRPKNFPEHFHAAQEDLMKSVKDSRMTFGDLERSCGIARNTTNLLTGDDVASFLQSLRKEESLNPAKFLLLGSMLMKQDMISGEEVTRLAADLPTLLPKAETLDTFCLIADCITILLDKQHSSVNQWTIDNLLACITITLFPQGPSIPTPNAAPILFSRLCRLISTLLSRHRIRLGGRYHLLLPALYGLLRCLFAPNNPHSLRTQSQVIFHSKLPPWLRNHQTTKLTKPSSILLTRLLTTICSPTPSAVKKRRTPNSSLTDATKKARRIAGEYMQYFIAEYISCQLASGGGIEASAKEGLMPGLYAVLDVMGRDGMRGLNARLDAGGRAMWKALYADWCRWGRWDGM